MPTASDIDRYQARSRAERLACIHARRARNIAGHWNGTFSSRQWLALLADGDHTCYLCGRRFPADQLEPEHLTPLARGGRNSTANIRPACRQCNGRKGNKTLGEYLVYIDGKETNQ